MRDSISTQEKSIVRRSFTLIHERFAVLFAAAAWPYAVTALCFLAVGFSYRLLHSPADYDPREVWTSMAPLQKFGVIFAYLVSISIPGDLAKASVTSSVWEDLQGNPVRVRDALSKIRHVLGRFVVLSLTVGFAQTVGSAFYLFPGLILMVLFSLAIPVLVIEHPEHFFAPIRRSWDLASKRFGTIFSAYAIIVLLVGMIAFAIFGTVANLLSWWSGLLVGWTLIVVILSLATMVLATVLTHIYHDLTHPVPPISNPASVL